MPIYLGDKTIDKSKRYRIIKDWECSLGSWGARLILKWNKDVRMWDVNDINGFVGRTGDGNVECMMIAGHIAPIETTNPHEDINTIAEMLETLLKDFVNKYPEYKFELGLRSDKAGYTLSAVVKEAQPSCN